MKVSFFPPFENWRLSYFLILIIYLLSLTICRVVGAVSTYRLRVGVAKKAIYIIALLTYCVKTQTRDLEALGTNRGTVSCWRGTCPQRAPHWLHHWKYSIPEICALVLWIAISTVLNDKSASDCGLTVLLHNIVFLTMILIIAHPLPEHLY